ncbi:MAG: hypothetical protein AAGI17_00240 [Planctomycetota bacterium]
MTDPKPTLPAPRLAPARGMEHQVAERRDIFWQNVMRETLSGLASAAAAMGGRMSATPSGAAQGGSPIGELFDGRMAVITRSGQRIPIADIVPLFACSVCQHTDDTAEDDMQRMISADVQCTVYQIRTPGGEVYTLPISEIVAMHALSDSLIKQLSQAAQQAAMSQQGPIDPGGGEPFGFAAFTSLAQSQREPKAAEQASNPSSQML